MTAAALISEAAVDGNRKEMADRVASFPARLSSREPENYAARAYPLRYENDFLCQGVLFRLGFSLFVWFALYQHLLSFLVRVDSDEPHSFRAYAAHERYHPRERGVICFVSLSCAFLHCLSVYVSFQESLFRFSSFFLACCFFTELFVPGTLTFTLLSSVQLRLLIFGFSVSVCDRIILIYLG